MALEWLDSGQVLHEDPEISLSNYGGLGSPLECHLRPPLLMRALKKSALNRGGRDRVRRSCHDSSS
jgi:glycine/D-amino acid oxidase-like deaminating enzyme